MRVWIVGIGLVALVWALDFGGPGSATASPSGTKAVTVPQITVGQISYRGAYLRFSVGGTQHFRSWVEYGPSSTYGSTCCDNVSQAGDYNFDIGLTNLQAGTRYHVRGVAIDGIGYDGTRSYGPSVTFTTKAAEPPTYVNIQTVWNNDCSCVNVQGELTLNGADTTVRYEYGTSAQLGSSTDPETVEAQSFGGGILINGQIRNLSAGTTYYWRAAVENAAGANRTAISTFTTGVPPPPLPPPPTTTVPRAPAPAPMPTPVPAPVPIPLPPTPLAPPAPPGPKLVARPTVTGTARIGRRLVGRVGRWTSGSRLASLRWVGCKAGGCRVVGRQRTIVLRLGHVGMRLRFEVRVAGANRSATGMSAWSAKVRR